MARPFYEPQKLSTLSVEERDDLLARGVECHRAGRLEDAVAAYRQILAGSPRDFDATHLLGVVALQQGRLELAQRMISNALAENPHDVSAMGNLGTSYMRDGQLDSALQWFEIALKLQPDAPVLLTNAGTVLHNMGRNAEAIPLLRRALAADPISYAVCSALGACLIKTGDAAEAAQLFDMATRSEPQDAEGWANLSVALNALGRHAEARECADKAVSLRPESSTALGALGAAQFEQGRMAEAIESYRQGVALAAPSAQMLLSFGHALLASGLNEEAIEQLDRAVSLDENNLAARWAIAIGHLKPVYSGESEIAASRERFSRSMEEVAAWYRNAGSIIEPYNAVGVNQPFYLAYQPYNNRDLLRRYGEICVSWMTSLPVTTVSEEPVDHAGGPAFQTTLDNRKLRIGIASAHIHEHSVWNAITKGWVNHLDRTKFDLYLFQLNPTSDRETDAARRVAAGFEDKPTNLAAWVQSIKASKLDVLIYPEIGMDPLTARLVSLRLAPVQAASWGHPETTGLPTIDLYISGQAFESPAAPANYTEKLLSLPHLGVHVEPLKPKFVKPSLRSLKLPGNEPLLLCPGAPFKYSPIYDEVWVQIAQHLEKRLLKRSSGGRLVFFRSRSDTIDRMLETRLRAAFRKAEVDFDSRVVILPTLERSQFYGLMRQAALMLDTLGFSGFNTALQAIECDLPVLAFEGEFMRGRLASGIMRRLNLPELVATTPEDFVQKARELAGDASRRDELRAALIERRGLLFEDMAPIRALERHLTDEVSQRSSGRTGFTS